MGIEAGDVISEVDPVPADDIVITIDPIEFLPVVDLDLPITDVVIDLPPEDGTSDLPPDAQTFGGPVDASADASTDGTGGNSDDGLIFTTYVVDGVADDGDVITDDGSEVVIDRPVDPMPEWRTLDGADGTTGDPAAGDTGEGAGGGEVVGGSGGDADTDSATPDSTPGKDPDTDVIYTLDPSDPLIYATSATDGPVRTVESQASFTAPYTPESEPDPMPVHYAASEPFHTGLDLL